MKIEHIAIWVKELENMRAFYEKYFNAKSSKKYHNKTTDFQSYFLEFENGCRLELMNKPEINEENTSHENQRLGIIHCAFSVGNEDRVNGLTLRLENDGIRVVGKPRMTGDGCYESVILDPENNIVEITV